jgi:hypothetical protein
LGSELLGRVRIVLEEDVAEGHHVFDERHGFHVDLGDEFCGLRHLVKVFGLELPATRQSGHLLTDLERRLGLLGDCVEPSLEGADLGRLCGQEFGRVVEQRIGVGDRLRKCLVNGVTLGRVFVVGQIGKHVIWHENHAAGCTHLCRSREVAMLDDIAGGRAYPRQFHRAEADHCQHCRRHHDHRDNRLRSKLQVVDAHSAAAFQTGPVHRERQSALSAGRSCGGIKESGSEPGRTWGFMPSTRESRRYVVP